MALVLPLTMPATTTLVDDVVVEVPEITYPEAYARVVVSRVMSDKSYICVGWYVSEAERFAGADPVKLSEFVAVTKDLVGDHFPAVYSFLKTLPEFAGATDHPFVDPAEVVAPPVEPTPEPTQPAAQA